MRELQHYNGVTFALPGERMDIKSTPTAAPTV